MSGLTQSNLTFGAKYVDSATGFTGKPIGCTIIWGGSVTVKLRSDDGEERDFDLAGVSFAI